MLTSGGPINDRSKTSMIPMLGDLRVIFKQPKYESQATHQDPLNGNIDLSTNPINIRDTAAHVRSWSTKSIESHHSLEQALSSMRKMETLAPSEPRTGLSPGVRWDTQLRPRPVDYGLQTFQSPYCGRNTRCNVEDKWLDNTSQRYPFHLSLRS